MSSDDDGAVKPKRTERLQVMLDDEELRAIEEWRFEQRIPSRAAAIRELIRRGMLYDQAAANELDPLGVKSTDFRAIPEERC